MSTRRPDALDRPAVVDAAAVRAQVLAPVTARREELDERLRKARVDLTELHEEGLRLQADHDAASAEARARHAALPPAPDLPDVTPAQELVHRIMRERPNLANLERDALAAAAPDVEAAWCTARTHLGAEAASLLTAAEALAATYAGWWNLLHDVRGAQEAANPSGRVSGGPSTRMGKRPDALAVLAAGHGADLCAFTPPPPPRW